MTKIGTEGKQKIYIVRSDKIIPSSQSDFDGDYTDSFITWRARKNLNGLGTFEGTLRADPTKDSPFSGDTKADDLKAGNFIFLMGGEKLICKFVIDKPIFDQTDNVKITGIEAVGRVENKLLHRTNVPKKTFNQANIVDDILWGSGGILVDGASQNYANYGTVENDVYVSMTVDYDNRLKALKESCNKAKKEFRIHHGYNTSTVPYSAGDKVDIEGTLGSGYSEKTFYLSGTNRNCKLCSGTKETESTANHIIMKGRDIRGKTIQTEVWDSTVRYAVDLSTTMDGWLDGDITATDMTINLKPGHGLESGETYTIKIDEELIYGTINGDVITVHTGERGSTTISMPDTMPAPHKDGSEVIVVEDSRDAAEFMRAYVGSLANAQAINTGVTTYIWVGNELMLYNGYDNNAGDYYLKVQRGWINSETLETYAHSEGVKIIPKERTISSPDSSPDTNSILVNGLITKSYTDNSAIGKDALDKKARQLLDSKKGVTKQIAINVRSPATVWADVCTTSEDTESCPIGQLVTLSDTDDINITAGDYRIVGYEYSGRRPQLIFYLNDTTVRGYSQGEYNFIDSYDYVSDDKRQESTRNINTEVDTYSLGYGGTDAFSVNNKEVTKVIVPMSAWNEQSLTPSSYLTSDYHSSAANIGYVNALVGGSGSAVWTESGSDLYPANGDRHVIPKTDGIGNVGITGASAKRWNTFNGINLRIWGNALLGTDSTDRLTVHGLIDSNLVPENSTYNLGDSGHRWGNVFGVLGNFSSAVTLGSTLSVAGASILNSLSLDSTLSVDGNVVSNLLPTQLTFDLGNDTHRWAHIYGCECNFSGGVTLGSTLYVSGNIASDGNLVINGNTTLGNASTDTITFNAKSATDLNMNGNEITNCYGMSRSGDLQFNAVGAYDVNINAGDDIKLDAGDDLSLTWNSNGTDRWLSFKGIDICPSVAQTLYLGSSSKEFERIYSCHFYGDLGSTFCDLAELQFVDKDIEEGHVVELCDGDSNEDKYLAEEAKRSLEKEKETGKKCNGGKLVGLRGKWKKASPNSFRCPSIISSFPGVRLGSTGLREELFEEGKMKYIALSGSVSNVHINGKFKAGDILVSAGKGFAKVDNKAPWNQAIGYAKQSGKDTICEVWVR